MNTVCHRFQFFRQFGNCSALYFLTVFVRNLTLHINIAIADKIELNRIGGVVINECRYVVNLDILALKVFTCGNGRSVI